MHRHSICCAMIVLSLGIGLQASSAQGDDRQAIQGTWQLVTAKLNGAPLPEDAARIHSIVISERTVTFRKDGAVDGPVPNYKLDATADIKEIDLTVEIDGKLLTAAGIYQLDGDTLMLCYASPGDVRPKKFDTVAGDARYFATFKRVK